MTSKYRQSGFLFQAIKPAAFAYLLLVFVVTTLGYISFEQAVLNMLLVIGAVEVAGIDQ